LIDEIRKQSHQIHDTVLQYRRHLHANPELSFQEFNTSAFIKSQLDQLEIPWKPMAGTGVVALIKGELSSGRVVALRADMDALPITEANDIPYVSKNKGIMHACGHDVHTSSLLGVAHILQSMKHQFGGTVKLIFQPGEEKLPGGASLMIKDGVLKDPVPDVIIGQHVSPAIASGKIGIRKGKFMASMDELLVTVRGKGGHAAQPHQNIDPVMIAAQILVSLQQVVSRMANPIIPSVLSFGKVIANGAINVIPDEVHLEGTFRTFDEQWRTEAHTQMKKIAEAIAAGMGGTCQFNIVKGYPYLVNEPELTGEVARIAETYLGKENVQEVDMWMAAEDFAYFSQSADSCFYLLGIRNEERGTVSSLHSSTFNIDEDALVDSIGLMAYIAIKQLGE
jgi:amidohydrolase